MRLRNLLLAAVAGAAVSLAAPAAQAAFVGPSPLGNQTNDVFGVAPGDANPVEGWYGANLYLIASGPVTATVEYLGREAGFSNRFTITSNAGSLTTGYIAGGTTPVSSVFGGTFATTPVGAGSLLLDPGVLAFVFDVDGGAASVANGGNSYAPGTPNFFVTLSNDPTSWDRNPNGGTPSSGISVLIALDDSGASADDNHDDLVIRITLTNGGTFTVPEPASMAILGLGLLGLGFAARRRA